MKHLIPLFRTDPIIKWAADREKTWEDAENHYEKLLAEMKKNLTHLVYLCSPLKPTKEKLVQDHISEAIKAASQILGAEYAGRKIAVWIPHVHLFSIYNEVIFPESREKAIKFNNHLLEKYFHTLLIVGDKISGGMKTEIELAKKKGIEVIKISDFKKSLKKLPNSEKAKKGHGKIVRTHNKVHGQQFLIKQ